VGPVRIAPRRLGSVLRTNPHCRPLLSMYEEVEDGGATSWNQVEDRFLAAMSEFDGSLPLAFVGDDDEKKEQSRRLSGALQNGKGDWFNNLIAVLLERCSQVETLYVRRSVPGLIIPTHNLDGVFPGDSSREIEFLLEAKMMGTPRHANSQGEKAAGRSGSADTKKRIGELAFKSIDLKGEASRRLTMIGQSPTGGGAGGGDLSTWLHASRPKIYFFLAVRVLGATDFAAVVRWAQTAAQVVDAVGLYCYEPVEGSFTTYRRCEGILERVLYRACLDLRGFASRLPPPIPVDVPPSPAAGAATLTGEMAED
jgi:hypothetical protein